MKLRTLTVTLAVLNLLLLVSSFAQARSGDVQSVDTVRARHFELVDNVGQVRYRLNVESDGEVVLRLLDQSGTIRVKLGAGRSGSGLVIVVKVTGVVIATCAGPTGNVTSRCSTARPRTS